MLAAIFLSICIVPAVDAKGITVGDQVYEKAAGQIQMTTVNVVNSPGASVAIGQQQARTRDDVPLTGTSRATSDCERCEEKALIPDKIVEERIPRDYVCEMLAFDSDERNTFKYVVGLFLDAVRISLWDVKTPIPTAEKLNNALAGANDPGTNKAQDWANSLRAVWDGPIIITKNNMAFTFAVAYHDGYTIECFSLHRRGEKLIVKSVGYVEIRGKGNSHNLPKNRAQTSWAEQID